MHLNSQTNHLNIQQINDVSNETQRNVSTNRA